MALRKLSERKERARSAGGNRKVPRNKRDQPLIKVMRPAPIKKDPGRMKEVLVPYTRMTTWIDVLEDKSAINMWYRRLALIGVATLEPEQQRRLLLEIRDCDRDGNKARLNQIAKWMHKEAGGEEKADLGDWLHELSENVDRGEALPADASDEDIADMAAYALATIDLEVKEIEHFVVLDDFKVGGTPDRMSYYNGLDPDGQPAGHVITDLKTGRTDFGGLKMAMQLAGYAHGRPYDPETGQRSDWPDDLNFRWGLIVNAPAGTGVCEVKWIDLTLGWRGFLLAKEVRELRNEGRRAFRPFPFVAQ